MKQLLEKVLNIRRGEFIVTLLMFFYYYLLLVTYYFLKPARDSLFLVKLGSEQLPVVFILIAIIVAPITALYSRASQSIRLNRLITITTVILISNLFILRWLVQLGDSWVYYAFYIWVSIYGILSTSQFWLFANVVYNPSQAKRLFVLLTLGGILGAFTGGEVTGFVVKNLGVATENLLFFCVGFLTLCIFLISIIWKLIQKEGGEIILPTRRELKKEKRGHIFGTICRSRHLMFIIGIITMTMLVASFVDFQFKTVSLEAFPEKADLTSFFGKFYGRLSLVSLFFQLIFTYAFLRILGVGGVILFLPFGLLVGSLAMLVSPGLLSGILLRGADGSFKYSIDKTGRELLFMPVPLEIKKRTKVFIDVVIDRGARGIAGGLLLLSLALGFSVRHISVVVLVFLAVWIFIAVLTKKEYLNAFRKALAKREIDPDKLRININEASTVEALKVSLKSDNDRQVEYALDMLTDVKNIKLQEVVRPLLKHTKPEIRVKTIRILQAQHKTEITGEIEEMVDDADTEVRLAAMYYLCQKTGDGGGDLLKNFLENTDPGIFSTAVRCIAEHGNPDQKRLLDDNIFRKLQEQKGEAGKDIRAQSAKALGALNKPEFRAYLMKLFEDSSADVVRQAIKSAGRTKDREFIPVLIKKLTDKQYRLEARNALAEYGNRVIGTLRDYLDDDSVDFVIRRNIPGVLSKIPTQESVNILTISITTTEPPIKYYIIKALNKLRLKYRELKYDRKKIDSALIMETMSYYEVLCVLELSKKREETPAGKLFRKALNEKLDINLEQIFRLLGLRYPSKDIYYAYQGITSNIDIIRSSAVEFMDNTLNSELKKYILPILEEDSPDVIIQQCRKLYNCKIETISEGLEYLIKGRDSWLKACALYIISEEKNEGLTSLVKESLHDPDPVVRETASMVMERM